jgi:uncharacterized protein YcfL
MIRTAAFLILALAVLAGCSSDKPKRIESDEKLPTSPCACGPQVRPLLWDAA